MGPESVFPDWQEWTNEEEPADEEHRRESLSRQEQSDTLPKIASPQIVREGSVLMWEFIPLFASLFSS